MMKSEVRSQKSEVTTQTSRYGLRPPLPIGREERSSERAVEPKETSDFCD